MGLLVFAFLACIFLRIAQNSELSSSATIVVTSDKCLLSGCNDVLFGVLLETIEHEPCHRNSLSSAIGPLLSRLLNIRQFLPHGPIEYYHLDQVTTEFCKA